MANQMPKSPVRGSKSDEIQKVKLSEDPQRSGSSPSPSAPPLRDENKSRLQDLEIERKEERKNAELYRTRCTSDKTDLYHLLGFYSVFQGVVFNTVATSAKLTCQTSLLPAMLSLLVFIGTAISVHYKLTDYKSDKKKLINSEHLAKFANDQMKLLKDNGDFNFENLYSKFKEKRDKKIQEDEGSRQMFKWIVMLFLFVFSVTVLACCIIIRCWDQDNRKSLMLCAFNICWERNITVTIVRF